MARDYNPELLSAQTVRRDYVPKDDYSPEFHRAEMERLWPRVWPLGGRSEQKRA